MEPGTQVDRYVIERILGEGGMAVVYAVRHVDLGSLHALKVLLVDRPALARRLENEGRVQASLRHPHIVAVHDVIEVDGNPGLLMELVDGIDLDEWIEQSPEADDTTRLELARQVLAAVGHAHKQGTIHRDLKPGNVMVTEVGGRPFAKVADFGLAKALRDETISHTRTGVPMGTPRYMAPEQITDAKNVDQRADIFALGCILHELWTGVPAFDATSIPEIFMDITTGAMPELDELPPTVASAIRGALERDPALRIQTCEELIEILDGDRAGPPMPVAPAASVVPPASVVAAAGVGGLGLAAVIVGAFLLLGCLGALGWSLTRPSSPAPSDDRPRLGNPGIPAPSPRPAPRVSPRPAPRAGPAPRPSPSPAPAPSPKPDKGKDHPGKGKDKDKK